MAEILIIKLEDILGLIINCTWFLIFFYYYKA